MAKLFWRPLAAGVLLLVLVLVGGCAGSGVAAPSASTPGVGATAESTATTAVAASPEATTALAPSPEATTALAPSPEATTAAAASPAAAAAEQSTAQPSATAAGSTDIATAEPTTGAASSPAATGTSVAAAPTAGADGITSATYTAVEYSFQGPDQLPAGWTRLTLDNRGKARHDLMLYGIEAGKTLQDVTQALAANGPPDWAHAYGSVSANAGAQASYLVDLKPGNYVMLSFGDNQQGPPDAAQGMLKLVMVTGTAPAPTSVQLPKPDATINMVDYRFEMTGTLKSGSQNILLTNSGTELHEAQVLQLKPGTTFEAFQKVLLQSTDPQNTQIPATPVWGMTLSPGISAYGSANLTPGDYAVVCFIPSAKNGGKPHYMLGMILSVTVK